MCRNGAGVLVRGRLSITIEMRRSRFSRAYGREIAEPLGGRVTRHPNGLWSG